jgi:hypothetical protein
VAKASYDGATGCVGSRCTDPGGYQTSNSARDLGNVATAVLIGGAVVALTGGTLWFTAPRAAPASSTQAAWDVSVTPGGAAVRAKF